MKPDAVYWDKPDLPDDLREMGDNLFPGMENCLRRAMLHSAARRIEWLESRQAEEWQPIESAPKDATVIQLWDGHRVYAGYWWQHQSAISDEQYHDRKYPWSVLDPTNVLNGLKGDFPILWKLPAPPKED